MPGRNAAPPHASSRGHVVGDGSLRHRMVSPKTRRFTRRTPLRRRQTVHRRTDLIASLTVVTSALLALTGCASLSDDRQGLRAPVFTLPRIDDGKPFGTPDLRGEPAIVVFWTPRCLPCAHELASIQEVWQRHQGEGLNVLGVQIGPLHEPPAPGIAELQGVTFPSVRDASGAVAGAFGVIGTPEAYFIGSDWRVWAVDRGDEVGVDEGRGLVIWSAIPEDLLLRRVADLLRPEPALRQSAAT